MSLNYFLENIIYIRTRFGSIFIYLYVNLIFLGWVLFLTFFSSENPFFLFIRRLSLKIS